MAHEKRRVLPQGGLRLRTSPRDGATVATLPQGATFDVIGREIWYRVKAGPIEGFVLGDHSELVTDGSPHPTIRPLEHEAFKSDTTIMVHEDFGQPLKALGERATALGVTVHVLSSLREPNVPVGGAIVEPARYSNHLVGHAIDVNLEVSGQRFNSERILEAFQTINADGSSDREPAPTQAAIQVRRFIAAVEELGLRWGGRFERPDPVHIDDNLNRAQGSEYRSQLVRLWSRSALA